MRIRDGGGSIVVSLGTHALSFSHGARYLDTAFSKKSL